MWQNTPMAMTTSTSAPLPAPRPARTRSLASRVLAVLLGAIAAVVLLLAAYIWFALSWSYSTGERAGYVQKFSKKGIISKTWEGELSMVSVPGVAPERFYFTVPDEAVAARINAAMGKKVSLRYEQHLPMPTTFFGETNYFVVGVREVRE